MKKTVGSQSVAALEGAQELMHSPFEQMQQQLQEYEASFYECVQLGKKMFDHDFYIVVETKKEPKLQNVIRNYFIPRRTCPTPNFDNTVYKYHRNEEREEFLWVLPSKDTYTMMLNNFLEIHESERDLLQFVLDDANGKLLQKCKLLNGELK